MHPILSKLLKQRNIQDKEQLSQEERLDFERWEKILDGGEITVDKIKKFCGQQIDLIESQWKDFNNGFEKNERLIIAHTIYKTLLRAIDSPEIERSTLEDYLNQLILKK